MNFGNNFVFLKNPKNKLIKKNLFFLNNYISFQEEQNFKKKGYNIYKINISLKDKKIKEEQDYILNLVERLSVSIGKYLNKELKLKNDDNFYKLLFNDWLLAITCNSYNKYKILKKIKNEYPNAGLVGLQNNEVCIENLDKFLFDISYSFDLNISLLSRISESLDFKIVNYHKNNELNIKSNYFNNLKKIFVNIKLYLLNIFFSINFKNNNSNIIDGDLLKLTDSLKIFLLSKFKLNIFFFNKNNNKNKIKKNILLNRINFTKKNNFEDILIQILHLYFPNSFLHFLSNLNSSNNSIQTKKFFFTSSSYFLSEQKLFYVLRNSYKVVGFQHGGNYKFEKFLMVRKIEKKKNYSTICWGSRAGSIPVHNFSDYAKSIKKIIPELNNRAVYITNSDSKYPTRLKYFLTEYYKEKYLNQQFFILKKLCSLLNLSVKFHPILESIDHWKHQDLITKIVNVHKIDPKYSFFDVINNSKINIFDHLSTGFLQSFLINKPTVIILDRSTIKFEDKYQNYFDALEKENIIFYNQEKFVNFMKYNHEFIADWWMKENKQILIKKICNSFYYYNKDYIYKLNNFFLKFNKNSVY
jgi:putative transferase (TIGR04331 family)